VGFSVFGVTSLFIALGLLPIVRIVSRDREQVELRTQKLIHHGFRFFLWVIETLGVGRIDRRGVERLAEPGILVIANHPTLIDVIALVASMPQADCVVKQENFENPYMRTVLRWSGYLPNTGGQSLVDAASERLRAGRSLVLFPEGTRSPASGLGHLQRGAAHIALATGCDPLPVVITCDPPTLMKGQAWYEVPDRPFELRVSVGEPFPVKGFIERGENRVRASRALTASLTEVFEKGLANAGS
jgi:1-acyl-sn-glycerol-3-phosphate acyltransferase